MSSMNSRQYINQSFVRIQKKAFNDKRKKSLKNTTIFFDYRFDNRDVSSKKFFKKKLRLIKNKFIILNFSNTIDFSIEFFR